jgi:hypothetical protein
MNYHQLTTTSPQKHHDKTPFFSKTPCKTPLHHTAKKNAAQPKPNRISNLKINLPYTPA